MRNVLDAVERKHRMTKKLTDEELNLARQWFDALRDVNPKYLARDDYVLGLKLYDFVGMKPDVKLEEVFRPILSSRGHQPLTPS